MHKKRTVRFRRRRRRQNEETMEAEATSTHSGRPPQQLGPHYMDGPAHKLGPHASAEETDLTSDEEQAVANIGMNDNAEKPLSGVMTQTQMPTLAGQGEPEHVVAFNQRGPLRLRGRTDATYDGGRFETENVTVRPGKGCAGCRGRQCIRASGTLVAHYQVQTSVTLPSVSDFPGLTPCQQRRVQNAIDNILAPHEQEHVRAFETYNGAARRAFDLTLCRSEFDGAIQRMFNVEAQARRAAAQAASDALDPFHFDVDLDCEELAPERQGAAAVTPETLPEEEQLT
jgi:hypothetical protein